MDMPPILKMIRDLRDGQVVTCHKCDKGNLVPVGDYKTTKVFHCDKCDYSITFD